MVSDRGGGNKSDAARDGSTRPVRADFVGIGLQSRSRVVR